jgi:DEAD/DEAH box helicase
MTTTNFYLPRPLKAHSLSTAVGSGKTRAAVAHMARNTWRNFIYVAPTIKLGEQTMEALVKASAGTGRSLHLINSANSKGKAKHEALRSINEVGGAEGSIHVVTTPTFLNILASIKRPELWCVLLDEAFDAATFETFSLGKDPRGGWEYFSEVFEVDVNDGGRIKPLPGQKTMVADLADGRLSEVGEKYKGLVGVAECPASTIESGVLPHEGMLPGEWLSFSPSRSTLSSKAEAAAVGNAAAQRRVVHGRGRCAAGASSICP